MASQKDLQVFKGDLDKVAAHFQAAIPITARKYLQPDRLTRIALNALSRSDQLMKCTRQSILLAIMDCVQVGLEPGGPLGHAYLVPFRNSRNNTHEATPIIGYKGYVTLAMRSGMFLGPPYVHLVHEADTFELDLGAGDPPRHTFDYRIPTSDRGGVLGGYCVGKFNKGGSHVEWMSLEDINKIKKRSKSANASFSPWKTDEGQMQRKTIIRRAKNYWPITGDMVVELAGAFGVDERSETGDRPDPGLIFDQEFLEVVEDIPNNVDADDTQANTGTDRAREVVQKNRDKGERLSDLCAAPGCENNAVAETLKCEAHA